jgi:hypothetical protein
MSQTETEALRQLLVNIVEGNIEDSPISAGYLNGHPGSGEYSMDAYVVLDGPLGLVARIIEGDWLKIHDAKQAIERHPVVTTAEDLDALSLDAVVVDRAGVPRTKRAGNSHMPGGWTHAGNSPLTSRELADGKPMTVIYPGRNFARPAPAEMMRSQLYDIWLEHTRHEATGERLAAQGFEIVDPKGIPAP